jgi:hypothetical protein
MALMVAPSPRFPEVVGDGNEFARIRVVCDHFLERSRRPALGRSSQGGADL